MLMRTLAGRQQAQQAPQQAGSRRGSCKAHAAAQAQHEPKPYPKLALLFLVSGQSHGGSSLVANEAVWRAWLSDAAALGRPEAGQALPPPLPAGARCIPKCDVITPSPNSCVGVLVPRACTTPCLLSAPQTRWRLRWRWTWSSWWAARCLLWHPMPNRGGGTRRQPGGLTRPNT